MHCVIIGNGVTGIEAALEARRLDPTARISIISVESEHFFSRPALMYLLAGQLRLADVEPHERDLYRAHRFDRVHARVVALDTERRTLRLANGGELQYDRLLIATGSRSRPGPWPGCGLRGVGAFVTMADLAWLEDELGLARSGVPVSDGPLPYGARPVARHGGPRVPVVIGGGLIGVEVVETLRALGHRPRFLIREESFWPMALDTREGLWIAEHMRKHGVEVILGAAVETLVDDGLGNVAAVETSVGRFDADLVIIAIGVVPNTAWLEGAVPVDARSGGVRVGLDLASEVDGVLAAGDCAALTNGDGTFRPEPLWYAARDQGRVAGRRLVGRVDEYRRGVPYNSAKLFDVEYTTVGTLAAPHRQLRAEEHGAVRSSVRLAERDDVLVGANLLGRRWDHAVVRGWIAERRPLAWVRENLSDASFDTEMVPLLDPAALRWEEG